MAGERVFDAEIVEMRGVVWPTQAGRPRPGDGGDRPGPDVTVGPRLAESRSGETLAAEAQQVPPKNVGGVPFPDLAWAAGLFEGEGCVSPTGNRGGFRLGLETTDHDVLVHFMDVVGGGSIHKRKMPKGKNWKQSYEWYIHGDPAVEIAQTLYPLLGKRRQGKIDEVLQKRRVHVATNGRRFRRRSQTERLW